MHYITSCRNIRSVGLNNSRGYEDVRAIMRIIMYSFSKSDPLPISTLRRAWWHYTYNISVNLTRNVVDQNISNGKTHTNCTCLAAVLSHNHRDLEKTHTAVARHTQRLRLTGYVHTLSLMTSTINSHNFMADITKTAILQILQVHNINLSKVTILVIAA